MLICGHVCEQRTRSVWLTISAMVNKRCAMTADDPDEDATAVYD